MDWSGLLRLGLHSLKLTPEVFWALTPAELLIMLGKSGAEAPMLAARLAALAQAYPDRSQDHEEAAQCPT